MRKITEAEAKKMMDDGNPYILVDVRNKDEYEEERIEGSVLIPLDVIEERAKSELGDKSARILVHCRSGKRSEAAAKILDELGYSDVNSFGGIENWTYGTIRGKTPTGA